MRHHIVRIFGLSAAALALAAATADAQLRRRDDSASQARRGTVSDGRTRDGVIRDRDRDRDRDRTTYGNERKVPPGLAKKPGQMPPGQYKKRYGTNQGADVLGGVLRRRGYSVIRVVPSGEAHHVFYRLRDGSERRAIVSPGADRLQFRNVPASLLQEVLAALY